MEIFEVSGALIMENYVVILGKVLPQSVALALATFFTGLIHRLLGEKH